MPSHIFDETPGPARRGGRAAAEATLAAIQPAEYTRSRNFLDGAVTRLSPYLRHGVLTLAEVRDHALAVVQQQEEAGKFINELAWRDYWQRLYTVLGNGIWKDLEAYKTGFAANTYATELPADLVTGTTGLLCMDSFSRQLPTTGYLHNHARMWMAAYVVHWLRIRWQAGASWFLEHLLDGDPASNNLSWQWVASTFGSKPYFFNRENLERYTAGRYCRECSLRANCPLDASYEDLEVKLFPHGTQISKTASPELVQIEKKLSEVPPSLTRPFLWVHADSLNPGNLKSVLEPHAQAGACFVWDENWLREENISAKRIVFIEECLAEFPPVLAIRRGDIAEQLLAAASAAGADHILAQRSPDPHLLTAARAIEKQLPLYWVDPPPFTSDAEEYDLKRFSRYWQRAKLSAFAPTAQ